MQNLAGCVALVLRPLQLKSRLEVFPPHSASRKSPDRLDVRSTFVQVDPKVSPVRPRRLHGNHYRYGGAWCGLRRKSHDCDGVESMCRLQRAWSQCPRYGKPNQLKIIATQSQECSELSSAEVQVKIFSTPLRFVEESSSQQLSPVRTRRLHGIRYRYGGVWCGLQRKSYDSDGMESATLRAPDTTIRSLSRAVGCVAQLSRLNLLCADRMLMLRSVPTASRMRLSGPAEGGP